MNAILLFQLNQGLSTQNGIELEIRMDLYRIQGGEGKKFPEGFKFSWIAFDQYDSSAKVLFDCHPPKGPHFHMDDDKEGVPFQWESLEKALELFWEKVEDRFGKRR
jgi:hypothetical protein